MKTTLATLMMAILLTAPVLADWDPGDGHKMHYAQTPLLGGWDVEFSASSLADDWQCSATGPVDDIHFWVSWMQDLVQQIDTFTVSIYSDVPDPDGTGPAFSMPGNAEWTRTFTPGEYMIRDMPNDLQDWYDPSQSGPPAWGLDDHVRWQQINIADIDQPFTQQEGVIYWLVVDFGQLPFVGWKQSGVLPFNDNAVWWDRINGGWKELVDPITAAPLDLAFVITPEPGSVLLLLAGGVMLRRRRR